MTSLGHPARPGDSVRFFADPRKAARHLCDHVLAAPECHAWGLVEPSIAEAVDLSDPDARWRAAEAALAGREPRLLDLYARAAGAESEDAGRLAWHVSEGDETLALGTSGVLLALEGDVLKTAFVPGLGSAAAVREARDDRALRREAGMRSGRPGHERDDRREERRRERWSAEERLFHDVFRPAVQHLRGSAYDAFDMEGRRTHRYGLLARVLPPMSRLKFHEWREHRARCREDRP